MNVHDWVIALLSVALVFGAVAGGFLWWEHRDSGQQALAESEFEDGEQPAALEARPAGEDDLYPSAPAISGPPAAGGAAVGSGSGGADADGYDLSVSAGPGQPDAGASGPHALAAATGGETIQEEIERLEARLTDLYDQLSAEARQADAEAAQLIAEDVDRWNAIIASGELGHAHWLCGPVCTGGPFAPLELEPLPPMIRLGPGLALTGSGLRM